MSIFIQWWPIEMRRQFCFCVSKTTVSMKTINIPLKSPIKLQLEMQKKFEIFQKLLVFRAILEKVVFSRNQSIFLNETFRKASSLILIKNEGIVDKHGHHLMPATPIFLKHRFFKIGPKNQHFLKKVKKNFAVLVAFL